MTVILRYIGHTLIVIGFFVMLNVDVFDGVMISTVGHSLILPWALQTRAWDLVILLAFFITIQVSKLGEILL